jgi:hypothetical protein
MWYRVNDPLSPLSGCDVRGQELSAYDKDGMALGRFLVITAARRVDVFQGDRPFQRVAAVGQTLGLLIDSSQLGASPIQDDVIELSTTSPYGRCVEERGHDRSDGLRLRVVEYELMAQVVLDDMASAMVITSATVALEALAFIETAFVGGAELDEVLALVAEEAI